MAKTQGLAAFSNRKTMPAAAVEETEEPTSGRSRGQGATVALSVRVSRTDWQRLRQLADDEGVSLQQLALRGFSRVLAEKGLPGMGK